MCRTDQWRRTRLPLIGHTWRTSSGQYPISLLITHHYTQNLNNIFNHCDFAIGSLARHRSGITHIKTLKNREYAARGFGFIYSETDDDFEQMPYILKVPADETAIDIPKLISFYQSLSLSPQEIRNSILHLSWKEQVKKVMAYE